MTDTASDYDVVIIGAGPAGLVCARHLDKAGLKVLCLERAGCAGGRLRTDEVEGFKLDRGFQVLLTGYEEVAGYLDLDALRPGFFEPGAMISRGQQSMIITDPLRRPMAIAPMLFSPVGSFADKIRVWRLVRELVNTPDRDLFDNARMTTAQWLASAGFSQAIIDNFFAPFFGGIFLESELATSAAQFRFIFKKFSEGMAAVPAGGMQSVAGQLQTFSPRVTFRFDTSVETIDGREIRLGSGERIGFKRVAIACKPDDLLPASRRPATSWHGTATLYFEAARSPLAKPLLVLNADANSPINNWCVLSDVQPSIAPEGKHLISVSTSGNPSMPDDELADRVGRDLSAMSGLRSEDLRLVRIYRIAEALPACRQVDYSLPCQATRLADDIFLAGDYLLNPSLDAAMRSGRLCATAILESNR